MSINANRSPSERNRAFDAACVRWEEAKPSERVGMFNPRACHTRPGTKPESTVENIIPITKRRK